MKTMKAIPHLLVASALFLGTACSSTTDTTSGTTAGSGTATSTDTDATSGGTGAGTGSTATSSESAGNGTGTDTGTGAGNGSSPNTGTTNQVGVGSGTNMAEGEASGTGSASDMTAFMGTFATMKDPVFLLTAASSNMLEIQAGQLASQRAASPEVKKFAQMMVSHHTKATQELKAVATPLGVTMPQTMMPVHQAMADRLMSKTGKGFDEDYMDLMETAHKMDIAMFEVKSKAAETPTVQSFATKTLPMLRSHHTMADKLEPKVD